MYHVKAARTQEKVEAGQCDVSCAADTLKEAKAKAKYMLSEEWARAAEMSEPFGYVAIVRDGELIDELFAK